MSFDFSGKSAPKRQIRMAGQSNTRTDRAAELRMKRQQRQQRMNQKQREESAIM